MANQKETGAGTITKGTRFVEGERTYTVTARRGNKCSTLDDQGRTADSAVSAIEKLIRYGLIKVLS